MSYITYIDAVSRFFTNFQHFADEKPILLLICLLRFDVEHTKIIYAYQIVCEAKFSLKS